MTTVSWRFSQHAECVGQDDAGSGCLQLTYAASIDMLVTLGEASATACRKHRPRASEEQHRNLTITEISTAAAQCIISEGSGKRWWGMLQQHNKLFWDASYHITTSLRPPPQPAATTVLLVAQS